MAQNWPKSVHCLAESLGSECSDPLLILWSPDFLRQLGLHPLKHNYNWFLSHPDLHHYLWLNYTKLFCKKNPINYKVFGTWSTVNWLGKALYWLRKNYSLLIYKFVRKVNNIFNDKVWHLENRGDFIWAGVVKRNLNFWQKLKLHVNLWLEILWKKKINNPYK